MMAADVDQFRGVLLGGAVGDALGAPLEGCLGSRSGDSTAGG